MNMPLSYRFPRLALGATLAAGLLGLSVPAWAQCSVVVTHSAANFGGGTFVVQAGFAEGEAAAASYTLDAGAFPIKLNLMEMIFATSNASVLTTTVYEVLVYEGTPATGTLIFSYQSNDVDIPHLRVGPGTAGTNVQFSIDPQDPEQIIINNNGSNTFSVGYRIVEHNDPPISPILPPNTATNCFPTTDGLNTLNFATQNWLDAIDIGPFGAPAGWSSFAQLPTQFRPTGDWNIRATYESVNPVTITDQPDDTAVNAGQTAIFNVVANGAALQYRWYKGTTPLNNGGNYLGVTNDTLVVLNTQAAQTGTYHVVVSNTCGTVTSNPATLNLIGSGQLSGNVTLNDWIATPSGQQMQFQIRAVGGATPLASFNATLNASGGFTAPLPGTIAPGTYDLYCDANHWLRKKRASVSISASGATGLNFVLKNGDSDGSGEVDAADIDVVIAAFGGTAIMADVDGSGEVDAADIDIVIANFGSTDD